MDYKVVIADSWKYTQANKKLIIWFGFLPALFTTTYAVGYMIYQFFAFKESFLFGESNDGVFGEVVGFIWNFLMEHVTWSVPLVVVAIVCSIIYLLLPTLAKASGIGTGLKYGLLSFLPLFEYHLLIKTFAFFSLLIEMSFVVRNLGPVIFKILLPVFVIATLIGLLLTLLFVYTDFYIVVDGHGVIASIKRSMKLVVTNWAHTFLIMILMILIGIRIMIQAVLVFLIPILIVAITGYMTTIVRPTTGLIIGGVVGIIALVVAAYINGIVDIFSYTVWTFTFLELSSEKEVSAREVLTDDVGENEKSEKQQEEEHKNL